MRVYLLILIILVAGCANQANDISSRVRDDIGLCDESSLLTTSPISLGELIGIAPLGNLNPPDHTLPTRHTYWYTADPANPPSILSDVVSPGNVKITEIQKTEFHDRDYAIDYTVIFYVCNEVNGYFNHILDLDESILERAGEFENCESRSTTTERVTECRKEVDIDVLAGDRLGTVSFYGTLDMGMDNFNVYHNVINEERLNFILTAECPFDYFEPGVREELLSRVGKYDGTVRRTLEPRCGQIHFDDTQSASGVWFLEDFDESQFLEGQSIALVKDNVNPTQSAFSIGRIGSILDDQVLRFTPDKESKEFSKIMDNQVHCYDVNGRSILIQKEGEILNFEAREQQCGQGWELENPIRFTR